jgi:hypothetical protein
VLTRIHFVVSVSQSVYHISYGTEPSAGNSNISKDGGPVTQLSYFSHIMKFFFTFNCDTCHIHLKFYTTFPLNFRSFVNSLDYLIYYISLTVV